MPNYHLGAALPICYPAGVTIAPTKATFTFYPNPATEKVTLQFSGSSTKAIECSFFDIAGRRVAGAPLNGSSDKVEIDVKHLPSGLYLYRVTEDGLIQTTGKFTKQ
jgi:hypothetical protein